ncbi:MAG: LysM peptidoglycan-binding domain-containing protein [Flavobacteriaceae bacterium]|nr:LysM peptidoglycan-binding domain-containing protein [Flavobacteriaceae bacterium]
MNKIKLSILLLFLVTVSIFSQEKKYTTYQSIKGETVYSISKKFMITPNDLLQLNPDIKNGIAEDQLIIVPNKNYNPELDTQKGDYVSGGYLYHKVLPKENYFRLKKQFGVPKRILRKHNLALRTDDLKVGQTIKIPIKKGYQITAVAVKADNTNTKPYLVKPRETKYSIARRYGIGVKRLEELNPHIKEGLKLAEIIKVPDTREIPDINEDFITHQVENKETLFSLSQQFKISQEQLISLNPDLKDGVKEGMLIKIPTELLAENTSLFVPSIPLNKQLKIAMMLPFTGRKNNLDFEKNRTLDRITDFYLGALIALDSVKKQGLSVKVKVFDTKNNTSTLSNIIRANSFNDTDAIIGPMFLNNVKFVSQNLRLDSVAIISPASSKDHIAFASKNMIKEMPSDELLTSKILDYIKKNYTDQRLVVIADDKKESESKINKIVAKLNLLDSIQKVVVLKPEKGYIKPELYKRTILKDKENWIVLISDDEIVTVDAVNNLGVLPKEINATLFALDYGSNYDKVINDHLARVNFHYPTANFVDHENDQVQKFIQKYKAKNHAEPSEYAFKGFDITYDVLLRLATYTDTESAFNGGISERTSCKFQYIKNPTKGFENKGVFLVKYDGLNLLKVED